MPKAKMKILLTIADVAFLCLLVIIPAFWVLEVITWPFFSKKITLSFHLAYFAIPALLLVTRAVLRKSSFLNDMVRCGPLEMPPLKSFALGLAALVLFVGLLEKMLALIDYKVDMAPVIFALTDAAGDTEEREGFADPELIFSFRKGEHYHRVMINNLGYRDREVDPEKAPGAMRVICMGDSVTAQGRPGYCGYLHEMLTADPPTPQPWEAFNMAVYGYSSVQGLRVFELQTRHLQPDIVTIFYGWNDHWLELQRDRDRMARRTGKFYGKIYDLLQNKRSFMLAHNLITHGDLGSRVRNEVGFRVPPDEYVDTLRRFVAEVRAVNAKPLLITAPRRTLKKYRDLEIDFNVVHDDYVEYTRQVARELNVDLLDLYEIFSSPEYDHYFSDDAIHFRQGGLKVIAEILDAKIRSMVGESQAAKF